MLMTLSDLVARYDMKVTGVLHVGAHLAEEAELYDQLDMGDVWWVEGNPNVIPIIKENLQRFPTQQVIPGLVYSEAGANLEFKITNYDGMSSSILEFGTHPQFSPDTVFVERITLTSTTIDTIVAEHDVQANFLNMDLQGAELYALRGATETLKSIDYVMSEVNCDEVYVGCARVEQLDDVLSDFERVETFWVGNQGWGDALYVRRP